MNGQALPVRYRVTAWLLRGFYFGRVSVRWAAPGQIRSSGARLIASSHRNGAIDGYTLLRAFPRAQFLVSVQLLRSRLLRLMFTGIPVVREKDRERYGLRRAAHDNPVDAGCAHLRAGGDLVIFTEGSSEWGYRPLPYQRGAARIARRMLDEGVAFQVIPVGLHYVQPDRFRSHVELYVGAPLNLPHPDSAQPACVIENQIHAAISAALDAVSVNCHSAAEFAAAETFARVCANAGRSYAEAFLEAQSRLEHGQPLPVPPDSPPRRSWPWDWPPVICFMLVCAPLLLAGWVAGRKADARNTVTFFRMAGGLLAAWLWIPAVLLVTVLWPMPALVAWCLAAWGWWRYPSVFR